MAEGPWTSNHPFSCFSSLYTFAYPATISQDASLQLNTPDHTDTGADAHLLMEKETTPRAPEGELPPTSNGTTVNPSHSLAPASNDGKAPTVPNLTTSGLNVVTHSAENPTPTNPKLPKASTNIAWSEPIGFHIRDAKDEPLMIFRRAVGINSDLAPLAGTRGGVRGTTGRGVQAAMEEGRRQPAGIYKHAIERKRKRRTQNLIISWTLDILHFAQVVIGAVLTALGPDAASHAVAITTLGALNTVIAGVLALLKGQGMPNKLHKDEMEFRRLQDWIEETEALLVTGIIGRDNRDIGVLVESAFRKYESAQMSVENNRPDNYVPDPGSQSKSRKLSKLKIDGDSGSKAVG